jgi:amino acid transporter
MIVLLLGLAVVALYHGKGTGGLTLRPFWAPGRFEPSAIFAATSISIMAFLGFDAVSTLSEEVAGSDRRLVGRAIIAVLGTSTAFFVVISWVLGNVLAGMQLVNLSAAAYEMTRYATGAWAAVLLAWCYALVVGFSNALPMQVGVARVLYAMGRDRQVPHWLSRVHPRFHTPYASMLFTAAVSLGVALAMRHMMDELATIVNFGALSGFILLHVSVLVHFGIRGRSRRFFAHWIVPVVGIAVVAAVFSGMSTLAVRVGVSWLALGIVWGLVLRARHRDELHAQL